MGSLAIELLRQLTRCGPQRAQDLAAACAATPGRIGCCLARLRAAGVVEETPRGLQLTAPFDFLCAAHIRAALGALAMDVQVADACESTNSTLLAEAAGAQPKLLLAEEQTAGRGRRGRRWVCGVGAGLTLSLRATLHRAPREAQGLSLAVGVAVCRALRSLGTDEAALKWPNDVLVGGAKLGGILIETRLQRQALTVVVGIGINCRLSPGLEGRLRRRIAALEDVLQPLPSRNALAARLALETLQALRAFETAGLAAFRHEWEAMHAHAGQRLRVRLADGRILAGLADGLCEDGGLRLRTRAGVRAVRSGQVVSARAA